MTNKQSAVRPSIQYRNLKDYQKEEMSMKRRSVKRMLVKLGIALVAVTMLFTATLAVDALAQNSGQGFLSYTGASQWWRATVTPGFFYTIVLQGFPSVPGWPCWCPSPFDPDLYVYDMFGNQLCASNGPTAFESCTVFASTGILRIQVVSAGGSGSYILSIR